ncbi:MAG: hypothetical protein LBP86_08590 [Azoarcus sp.]|jgi:beta-N-acetylhexosaminidase|nr:hypothetical protein [Azoarcus sp.]
MMTTPAPARPSRLAALRRLGRAPWQRTLLAWIALAVLIFFAARYFKHPMFHFWRGAELPVLLLAAIALAGGAYRGLRAAAHGHGRGRLEPGLRLAACLSLLCLVAGQEGGYRWQQFSVRQGSVAMQRMGRHFVIGFRDFDQLPTLAERGLIGGIYITRRNLRGETVHSLRRRIDALQAARARAGLPPLFVMADQEGGEVSHLSPLVEPMPPLAALVAGDMNMNMDMNMEEAEAHARDYGERQGRAMAALGLNMNLAPVVDLKPGQERDWIDRNTRIERRAIASDPRIVAKVAIAYGTGLSASGILPTVKHFPGLGRVRGDTHVVEASLMHTPAERAADWLPFREVTARTGAAMMLSHVRLPDIDPHAPASLSRTLVQDILRKKSGAGWDYQGILMTDDLNMGAVYAGGIGRAATAALDAGVDLVLISHDPDQYYRALHAAAMAWRGGAIDAGREIESAKRLDKYWEEDRPIATRPTRFARTGAARQ